MHFKLFIVTGGLLVSELQLHHRQQRPLPLHLGIHEPSISQHFHTGRLQISRVCAMIHHVHPVCVCVPYPQGVHVHLPYIRGSEHSHACKMQIGNETLIFHHIKPKEPLVFSPVRIRQKSRALIFFFEEIYPKIRLLC